MQISDRELVSGLNIDQLQNDKEITITGVDFRALRWAAAILDMKAMKTMTCRNPVQLWIIGISDVMPVHGKWRLSVSGDDARRVDCTSNNAPLPASTKDLLAFHLKIILNRKHVGHSVRPRARDLLVHLVCDNALKPHMPIFHNDVNRWQRLKTVAG